MDWLDIALGHESLASKVARGALWLQCQAPDLSDVVDAAGATELANVLPYLDPCAVLACLDANRHLLPRDLRGAYLPMVH